jgi:hypothetical protein
LVGLLTVLAPALPVALPGDGAVAATRRANLTGGEHEVDVGEDVVDPIGVVLDAARVHDHAGLRASVNERGLHDAFGGHARYLGCDLRRVAERQFARFIPAVGARGDEVLVNQLLSNENVEHPVRESHVRAGPQLEVDIALPRGRRLARVNDDPDASVVALLPEELVQHGECLGGVRARED